MVGPLVSYGDFSRTWREATTVGVRYVPWANFIALGPALLALYASIAGVLTYRSIKRFDRWLDRPRMDEAAPVPVKKPVVPEVVEPVLQS